MNIIFHRGDTNIAQENTLDAINCNHKIIEIDILCDTIDLYLIHDPNLKRLTGEDIFLNNVKTKSQLTILNKIEYEDRELIYDKHRDICKFEDVLDIVSKSDKMLCLDLKITNFTEKSKSIVNKLMTLIEKYKDNIMYVSSFDIDLIMYIRNNLDCVDYGLFMSSEKYDPDQYINTINPKYLIYSVDDIDKIKKANREIIIYTVHKNDINTVQDYNVDYIVVDTFNKN